MSRMLFFCLAATIAATHLACDEGPTAPDFDGPEMYIGCGQVLDGYQCQAEYVTSGAAPRQDVTGLVAWSTSDASVATVDSVGFVTVTRAGNVAIRASYRGVEAFTAMAVETGGLRRYYRAVSGFVTDAQNGSKLSGVMVRIVDGPNANRSTTTGSDGAYQLYDLEVGSFTLRFSRTGYATLDRAFTLTGNTLNDVSVGLTR